MCVAKVIVAFALLFVLYADPALSASFCNSTNELTDAFVADGFCAVTWATNLNRPRGIALAQNGDLLVVESGSSSISVLWDSNKDGTSGPNERAQLARQQGLNHGIAIDADRKWLYASTSTEVYRWNYTSGMRQPLGDPVLVIKNIPCCHHVSRTLLLKNNGDILVSVGSASNVDDNDLHARIHLFSLSSIQEAVRSGKPVDWNNGSTFAAGLRNEVGIGFDLKGRVWGVENGVDQLSRPDLAPDLVFNNPAEELNLFEEEGAFYGYPYCWSEYKIPPPNGEGPGAQWVHPKFMNSGKPYGTDAWCKNPANVVRPQYTLPAHSAPLDIKFYDGPKFPKDFVGDAFVSLHGSWNRAVPIGYAVVRVHFTKDTDKPVSHSILLSNKNPPPDGPTTWKHRPVGLSIGHCGDGFECVYVSSDASGVILAVAYDSTA